MSSRDLVICDGKKKKVQFLDKSFGIKGSATLQSQPWDVSEIDSKTVVVTLPYVKHNKVYRSTAVFARDTKFQLRHDVVGYTCVQRRNICNPSKQMIRRRRGDSSGL